MKSFLASFFLLPSALATYHISFSVDIPYGTGVPSHSESSTSTSVSVPSVPAYHYPYNLNTAISQLIPHIPYPTGGANAPPSTLSSVTGKKNCTCHHSTGVPDQPYSQGTSVIPLVTGTASVGTGGVAGATNGTTYNPPAPTQPPSDQQGTGTPIPPSSTTGPTDPLFTGAAAKPAAQWVVGALVGVGAVMFAL